MTTGRWTDRARCASAIRAGEAKAEWWFPDRELEGQRNGAKARAICAECPVARECLEAGIGEQDGIWGGLGHTRRKGKVRRRCQVCGTDIGFAGYYCEPCAKAARRKTYSESHARRRMAM